MDGYGIKSPITGPKPASFDGGTSTISSGSGSLATGIIGGLTELADLGVKIWSTYKTLEQGKKNYELQKDMLKYNKDLQREMMEREDNAVLRRVLDLRRAGLSPTLAAGSAAAPGPVVKTETPQSNIDYRMPNLPNVAATSMALMQQKAQIDRTYAENEYIKQQEKKARAETAWTNIKAGQSAIDLKNQQGSGMSSNPSLFGKWWNDFWAGTTNDTTAKQYMKDLYNKLNEKKVMRTGASGGW